MILLYYYYIIKKIDRRKKLRLLILPKKLALLAAEEGTTDNQVTSRILVHEINAQRKEKVIYHTLVQKLRLDNDRHEQYFRIKNKVLIIC